MADAFPKADRPVPTAIGTIQVHLADVVLGPGGAVIDGAPGLRGTFEIDVLDAGGRSIGRLTGDLLSRLTAAQITTITNFLATIRTKSAAEVLL